MDTKEGPNSGVASGHIDLVVLGLRVHISGTNRSFEEAMRDLKDPDPSDPDVRLRLASWGEAVALIREDGSPVSVSPAGQDPIANFVSALNLLGLDHDTDRLHVHAALVEIHGSGVMLCGPSGAGKSTLAAALMERGARYLTDETVAILPGSRTLRSFPKPLILKGWAVSRFAGEPSAHRGRVAIPASSLGDTAVGSVCREVVFPRFEEGAELELTRISPAQAVGHVVQESLDIKRFGPEALLVIADLVARAACWELTYGDVDQAAEILAAPLDTPKESPWSIIHLDRRAATVRVDGADLTLDAAHQVFTSRVGQPSVVPKPPATPRFAPDLIASLATRLKDAGICFVVAGETIALLDGPLPDLTHPPLGPALVVKPRDLQRARSIAGEISDSHLADEIEGHPSLANGELLFDLIECSAIQVRLGTHWVAGLHPKHQFLLAAIQNSLKPGSIPAATINALGRLPQRMLQGAFNDASRIGMLRQIQSSVAASAVDAPGMTRALVETYRAS